MLILLSPSKTLDFESPLPKLAATQPQFLEQSHLLIKELRKKSEQDLQDLMGISPKLAALNAERYRDFKTPFTEKNARPCLFAFKGDVYDGLQAESLSAAALKRAQAEIRILSGLYGLLRPFDLMQPYRLEMGIRLKNPRGKNLYQFWGDRITDALNAELATHKDKTIINLASEEYFKAINAKKLEGELITPVFKEIKGNQMKVVGLFAKKARGMMARHLIDGNRLISFDYSGYRLHPASDNSGDVLFSRKSA